MTDFSAHWLALREAVDHEARDLDLVQHLNTWRQKIDQVEIADLGAGTGSNLRFLAPRLSGRQAWHLYDRDHALLGLAYDQIEAWAERLGLSHQRCGDRLQISGGDLELTVVCTALDMARGLEQTDFPVGGLVTAAALLDLVSERWLTALARHCRETRTAFHAALSYDGRISCQPGDRCDGLVHDLHNRHQRRDKGFGLALGPNAAETAAGMFRSQGFSVRVAKSDWRLEADQAPLQALLLEGWADAALELAPQKAAEIRAWLRRRLACRWQSGACLKVGHQDLLALP